MKLLIYIFSTLFFSATAFSQSLNTSVVGQVKYNTSLNDIWGYTDQQGNDYAIVGLRTGVSFVKVEEDTSYEVDFKPGINSIWRDMKTYQNYAYVTNEKGQGLAIFDLSALPDSARLVKRDVSNFTQAHNISIADGYAYIAGYNADSGGALILDLADPENPTVAGRSTFSYYHDVFVQNNILYGSAGNRSSLVILDIQDKQAPVMLAEIPFPIEGGYSHNVWATEDGNYAMTTEETIGFSVKMWDISNLNNPKLLDEYLASPGWLAHNVIIKGNYAYLSHYSHGVRILDISNPEDIDLVGYYDTFPGDPSGYDGCWGVFPFSSSGYIYASDQSTGFHAIDFTGRQKSRFRALALDAQTNAPIAQADITLNGQALTTKTDGQGKFNLGFTEPGNYSLSFRKSGYDTVSINLTLDAGQAEFRKIMLNPVTVSVQQSDPKIPASFQLHANYPNPFNAGTVISYDLPQAEHVSLRIFDTLGKEVAVLVNQVQTPGAHRITWNGNTRNGQNAASGVYLYTLKAGKFKSSNKMLMIR